MFISFVSACYIYVQSTSRPITYFLLEREAYPLCTGIDWCHNFLLAFYTGIRSHLIVMSPVLHPNYIFPTAAKNWKFYLILLQIINRLYAAVQQSGHTLTLQFHGPATSWQETQIHRTMRKLVFNSPPSYGRRHK